MSSKVAVANELRELDSHPASIAWRLAVDDRRRPSSIETLKLERQKSAVYRLHLPDRRERSAIAKRRPEGELAAEVRIHEKLLPELALGSLEVYGHVGGVDGFDWLFLEDAGETRYSRDAPEHQSLAVEWLARLHAGAAPGASWLPDTGPDYFRSVLDLARAGLRRGLAHAAVSASDRDVLNAIARSLETVEARWSRLEDVCARVPRTLVHGDFVPKNVRLRERLGRLDLVAFDWETAGVAPPAVDLAHLGATDVDFRRYLAIVRDVWPALRIRDLRQLSRVGTLFWLLHAIYWAGRSFAHDWVQHAMWDLIEYDRDLRIALAATDRSEREPG